MDSTFLYAISFNLKADGHGASISGQPTNSLTLKRLPDSVLEFEHCCAVFIEMHQDVDLEFELWSNSDRRWVTDFLPQSSRDVIEGMTDRTGTDVFTLPVLGKDEVSVLHVPVNSDYEPDFTAFALVPTADARQHVSYFRTLIEKMELKRQLTEINEEKDDFLRQASHDMEELIFLRDLCSCLEVREPIDSLNSFFEKVVVQCHAERIAFLGSDNFVAEFAEQADYSLRQFTNINQELYESEVPKLTQESLRYLTEAFNVRKRPVVRNHFVIPQDTDRFQDGFVHSFMIAPVQKGERNFGWLITVNRLQRDEYDFSYAPNTGICEFGSVEAGILSSAASMLGTHLSNISLFAVNKQMVTDVVRCLVSAIDSKDSYTCGHSERVAQYARRLAQEVGYEDEQLERLYLSGLLHDVGKIGISDSILSKPGKPTDEEFNEIKKHPEEGWKILQGLKQLNDVLGGVLFHHERVDGAGYPDRLVGDEIPLAARILAVADSFDAMTSDRSYRIGMSSDKAVEILKEGAGTQWDAALVDKFISIIDDILEIRENYVANPDPIRVPKSTLRSPK